MEPIIRPYQESDFERLLELEQECFAPEIAYDRELLTSLVTDPAIVTLVVERDSRVIGFTIGETVHDRIGIVSTIEVDTTERRNGIGRMLLMAIENALREKNCSAIQLDVATHNIAAIRLYENHGYSCITIRMNHYADGSSAYGMIKSLEKPPAPEPTVEDILVQALEDKKNADKQPEQPLLEMY